MKQLQPRNTYTNAEDQQTAGVLLKLIPASLVIYSILIVSALFARDWKMFAVGGIGVVVQAILFWLIKTKKVFAASVILMALTFGLATEFATIGQGIRDAALVSFPIIFIFAGLTFNRTILRICVAMSVIAIGWLAFGERYGLFVPYPLSTKPGWFEFAIATMLLIVAGMAVSLLTTNMKKNLDQTRLGEIRYFEIFDKAPVAMVRAKLDGSAILEANQELVKLSGYSKQELAGKPVTSFFQNPDKLNEILAALLKNGRIESYDIDFIDKEGKIRNCLTNFKLYADKGYLEGTIVDVTERKKAENELLLSNNKLAKILTTLQDAYFQADTSGNFITVNPMAVKMYGYGSDDEMIGMPASLLYADKKERDALLGKLKISDFINDYIGHGLRKDGSVFPVSMNVKYLRDDAGQVIGTEGVVRDITERQIADEALRKSETLYHDTFDNAPIGIFQSTEDGKFIIVNNMLAQMLGFESPKEMISHVNQTNIAQALFVDPHRRAKIINDVKTKIGWYTYENEYRRKDGRILIGRLNTHIIMKPDGNVDHIEGMLEDITERKQAETSLEKSEKRFRQIAEDAGEWIWEVDNEGIYTYCSPAVETILGYTPQELVGKKHFYDLYTPNAREQLKQTTFAAFMSRKVTKKLLNSNLHKNGATVILETNESPIFDDKGDVVGYRGADTDVTEREHSEQQLRQRNCELALINQIGQRLNQMNNPLEILDCIYSEIAKLTDTNNLYIAQYDDDRQYISFDLYYIDGVPQTFAGRTLGDGMTDYIIRTKSPVLVKRDFETFRQEHGIALKGKPSFSFLGVPMIAEDKVIGVIATQDYNIENAYDENDLELWTTIAAQASGALKNAQLFKALQIELDEHKIAEDALIRDEAKFRSTFDQSPVGSVIVSLDKRFIRCNSAFCSFLGYAESELIGKTIADVTYPEDIELGMKEMKQLIQGEITTCSLQKRYLHKNGSFVWAEISISLVHDIDGKPLYFIPIIQDITVRKIADEALKKSETLYHDTFDNAPLGIFHSTEQGKFITVNNKAAQIFGYATPDEMVRDVNKTNIAQALYADPPKRAGIVDEAKKGTGWFYFENDYRRKDGSILKGKVSTHFILKPDGTIDHIEGMIEDVTDFNLAQESLKFNEERFRLLAESALVGFYILQDGKYSYANPAMAKMFGYSVDEFIGMVPNQIVDPEDHEMVGEKIRSRIDGEVKSVQYAVRVKRKDGSHGWVEVYGSRIDLGGKPALLGTLIDISERKRAENMVQDIIDKNPISIQVVDTEGFTIRGNSAYTELFGSFPPPDFSIFDDLKSKSPDLETIIMRAKSGEVGYFPDMYFNPHDSSPEAPDHPVWVRASIFPIGTDKLKAEHFVLMHQDITEHKQLEETQRFLAQCGLPGSGQDFFEGLAKHLAHSLNMEYVCIDRLEGDGLTANTVAIYNNGVYEPNVSYALKDTPCGDVVGKTICCFPRDASRLFPKDAALQDLKAESYIGTTLWSFDAKPIGLIAVIGQKPIGNRNLAESLLKMVGIRAAGELERKKAEEETNHLRNKAEMSSRLAAVGEMAAGIAHEINNPLTGVVGFSELLMEKKDVPVDIKEPIKIINDGSKRVMEIVKRMLTFARQAKPVKTRANINELIDATLGLRAYVLRTNSIEVVKIYDPKLPWVTVDSGQMQQVFLNLIVNAEYAMKKIHDKGILTITTQKIDDNIHILFKDDGMGIDQNTKAKIFNPFFTSKPEGEGTGLGLSLSRSIILEHGGTITFESKPGQGATFIITLPITPSIEGPDTIETTAPQTQAKFKGARVLVVDDEDAIRKLIGTILSKNGYAVETTGDAREALLKMASTNYDAVLVDIRMPNMGGIEVYNNIKANRPELAGKLIFITGDTSDANTRDFLEKYDLPYITKPFDRETLLKKVNALIYLPG